MATNFPGSLQDLDATRGGTTDKLNSPSHVTHHELEDDTLEALETKVGADSSAVTTSHDYLLRNLPEQDADWDLGPWDLSLTDITASGNILTANNITGGTLDISGSASVQDLQSSGVIRTANSIEGGTLDITGSASIQDLEASGNIYTANSVEAGTINVGLIEIAYGSAILNAIEATSISVASLTRGAVSDTEFSYLDGVGTAIQTELNTKAGDGAVLKHDGTVPLSAAWNAGNSIDAESFTGTTITAGGNIDAVGNVLATDITASGNILTANDITGGTLDVTGSASIQDLQASGNIRTANDIEGGTITATTIAGIASANFVDKSAGESITGDWSFSMADIASGTAILEKIDTSALTIGDYSLPTADGGLNEIIQTDGAGALSWVAVGAGDVVGPASSVDNTLVRFNSTGGKTIQESAITLDDAAGLTGVGNISFTAVTNTIGGIQSQNLLDKSAGEIVTGQWKLDAVDIIYGSAILNVVEATSISVASLTRGAVSDTEFSYLDGVGTAIQTELNTKAGDNAVLKKDGSVPMTSLWDTGNDLTAESLDATTIASITNSNLVDKSATEAITGEWSFDLIDINDGSAILYNTDTTTLSAGTINAFSLGGKLTGGANEIEGSNFDITGGSINGATVGLTTPSTGSFTVLDVSTTANVEDLIVNKHAYFDEEVDLSDLETTTITVDWTAGNKQLVSLGGTSAGAVAFTNPTGPANLVLRVLQSASTTSTIEDWAPGTILWAGATTPTISEGASDVDIIGLYFDGGGSYYAVESLDFS